MAFCPRCGAATQPGSAFCPACGGPLAPQLQPAPSPQPQPAQPYPLPPGYVPAAGYGTVPTRATGPRGRVMEPWVVVLLMFVTLGIYSAFYWWRVSREMDEHVGKPGHAHRLVQVGVIVMAISGIALAFLAISFFTAAFAAGFASDTTGQPPEDVMIATIVGSIGLLVLAALAFTGGRIALLVGKYRVWQEMEGQERARQHPNPTNTALFLALGIGGILLGGIGTILNLIVGYMTQDRLNAIWASS